MPRTYKPWGKSVAIDLYNCDHETMVDPEGLKKFITELVKSVDMVAHGPCYIDRFGEGQLLGYSAMQFIETSSVTVHLDEVDNRAFVDVFSCKKFDESKALAVAQRYFGTDKAKLTALER